MSDLLLNISQKLQTLVLPGGALLIVGALTESEDPGNGLSLYIGFIGLGFVVLGIISAIYSVEGGA